MDHVHQNRRPSTGFSIIPDRLINDATLTADARMALIWICTRPDGFLCRTSMIQDALGIGKDRWQRIFRELRAAGAITQQWRRNTTTGQLRGKAYHWSWEKWLTTPESRETRPSEHKQNKATESRVSRQSGNPAQNGGKSGPERRETRLLKEERYNKKDGAARRGLEAWKAWQTEHPGSSYGQWMDSPEYREHLASERATTEP